MSAPTPNEQDPAARGSGHEPSDPVQWLSEAIREMDNAIVGSCSASVMGHGVASARATEGRAKVERSAALAAVEREMAELQEKAAAWTQVEAVFGEGWYSVGNELIRRRDRIAALEAERDELRKDKERLDWLEECGAVYGPWIGYECEHAFAWNRDWFGTMRVQSRDIPPLRSAIDAEKAKATEVQHG